MSPIPKLNPACQDCNVLAGTVTKLRLTPVPIVLLGEQRLQRLRRQIHLVFTRPEICESLEPSVLTTTPLGRLRLKLLVSRQTQPPTVVSNHSSSSPVNSLSIVRGRLQLLIITYEPRQAEQASL